VSGWVTAAMIGVAIYAAILLGLVLAGRGVRARELALLVPTLVLLFKDLLADRRVPRGAKAWVVVALLYLLNPLDLVPEFLPVIGPIDDAIVAALALRHLVRAAGATIVHERWRGDAATLDRLLRAARITP
jgi:uncharacterized membrane protein YkvA (DUF1232 family)